MFFFFHFRTQLCLFSVKRNDEIFIYYQTRTEGNIIKGVTKNRTRINLWGMLSAPLWVKGGEGRMREKERERENSPRVPHRLSKLLSILKQNAFPRFIIAPGNDARVSYTLSTSQLPLRPGFTYTLLNRNVRPVCTSLAHPLGKCRQLVLSLFLFASRSFPPRISLPLTIMSLSLSSSLSLPS